MNNSKLELQVNAHGIHLGKQVQKVIERGVARLEGWTRKFPTRTVRLNISRRERDGVHRAELVLELPRKTIVAHEEVPNLLTAVERSFRKAYRQLREFKAVLRRNHLYSQMRNARDALPALTEAEIGAAAKQRNLEHFKSEVEAHIGRLTRFINSETALLKLHLSHIHPSVPDLVDEALMTALERFDQKPVSMPSSQWLYGVALDVMESYAQRKTAERDAGLTPLADEDGHPPRDEVENLLDNFLMKAELIEDQPEKTEDTVDATMAGPGPSDPALRMEQEEMEERVRRVLSELPRAWRRSFVLHFMEGFDLAEVGQIQNLDEVQVTIQVQSAELFLRERLGELALNS